MESITDQIDEVLKKDWALPGIHDLIPLPGDIAHALFGSKTLDNVGKSIGSGLKSTASSGASGLPKVLS